MVLPGVAHHVTQRGVRLMNIFLDDSDRMFYLKLIDEQARKADMQIIGYCLMDNHVHFLVIPSAEDSLKNAFGEAHRLYTKQFNFRAKARGYLFQGRFFSCPLDDRHLLAAARYVERNPVRCGICQLPENYFWSSARFNLGIIANDPLIQTKHAIYGDPEEWQKWLKSDPENIDQLRMNFRTGRPLGDSTFIKQAELNTGRCLTPKRPGPEKGWRTN